MQKIHRRKNQDIVKEFQCTEGCGKAYGSYAALYTHIKTKHSNVKPPQMKAGPLQHKPLGRKTKDRVDLDRQQRRMDELYDCKACRKVDCICPDQLDGEQIDRTIAIMSDQAFVKFVNCIGQLTIDQKFSWVRKTEEDFHFLDGETLRAMAEDFNEKYLGQQQNHISLSLKCIQFLSFSSRFWQKKLIDQLYKGIFAAISKETPQQLQDLLKNTDLENIKQIQSIRSAEWKQFVDLIKAL